MTATTTTSTTSTSTTSSKRTNARRCCLSCRRRKVRCQLPDPLVPNDPRPLPHSQACVRCRELGISCVVCDQELKRQPKLEIQPSTTSSSSSSSTSPMANFSSPPQHGVGPTSLILPPPPPMPLSSSASSSAAFLAPSFSVKRRKRSADSYPFRERHKTHPITSTAKLNALTPVDGEDWAEGEEDGAASIVSRDSGEYHHALSSSVGSTASAPLPLPLLHHHHHPHHHPPPPTGGTCDDVAISYLHRPLFALGQLLATEKQHELYVVGRIDPELPQSTTIHDVVDQALVERLEPHIVSFLAWHPYVPPLGLVYARAQSTPSVPHDLLLAVLCLLGCRLSGTLDSDVFIKLSTIVDRVGTICLLSPPRTPELVIAFNLLVAYDPTLVGTASRLGPMGNAKLEGSAIVGETLLNVATATAKGLGYDQVAAQIQFHHPIQSVCTTTQLDASASYTFTAVDLALLWWNLSVWNGHFSFINTPLRPMDFAAEAEAAQRYLTSEAASEAATFLPQGASAGANAASLATDKDATAGLGRTVLAHRVLTLAAVHSNLSYLRHISAPAVATAEDQADLLNRLSAFVEHCAAELNARANTRTSDLSAFIELPLSRVMASWMELEQNSLQSLLLSKVSCTAVTGSMDLNIPLRDFVTRISASYTVSEWLRRPGQLRRELTEEALAIFSRLEMSNDPAYPNAPASDAAAFKRQRSNSALGVGVGVGGAQSPSLNSSCRWLQSGFDSSRGGCFEPGAIPLTLTMALILDSCRMLMEGEAFTLIVHQRMLTNTNRASVLLERAAERLEFQDRTVELLPSHAQGAAAADDAAQDEASKLRPLSPAQITAGRIYDALATRDRWAKQAAWRRAKAARRARERERMDAAKRAAGRSSMGITSSNILDSSASTTSSSDGHGWPSAPNSVDASHSPDTGAYAPTRRSSPDEQRPRSQQHIMYHMNPAYGHHGGHPGVHHGGHHAHHHTQGNNYLHDSVHMQGGHMQQHGGSAIEFPNAGAGDMSSQLFQMGTSTPTCGAAASANGGGEMFHPSPSSLSQEEWIEFILSDWLLPPSTMPAPAPSSTS